MNTNQGPTEQFEQKDIEQNKVLSIIAYLGILVLVPILAAKESKFAKFHSNQGLLLFLGIVGYGIIEAIILAIFRLILIRGAGMFGLYGFIRAVLNLVYILFTVLAIIGMINASSGKAKELPIIGKYRILK